MMDTQHNQYRTAPINNQGRAFDPDATSDERSYALFMHLALLGHMVIPFFTILVPIIMWSTKKEESPFIDDHGREAINFQISLLIYSVIWIPIGFLTCGIGFFLAFLPYVLGLIGMIQASIAANRGEFYRYPMTIRFLH